MFRRRENKVFYLLFSAAIAFSLILANGAAWAVMDRQIQIEPMMGEPSPIVPIPDCDYYNYSGCREDYRWCQQFRDPSRCWNYVGSCVKGGGTPLSCRQRCAQYGVNCQPK